MREVPPDIQKKRFNNFEARRIWKLAAVLVERQHQIEVARERAEKESEVQRAMVRTYSAVIERETERVAKAASAVQRFERTLKKQTATLKLRKDEFDEKLQVG